MKHLMILLLLSHLLFGSGESDDAKGQKVLYANLAASTFIVGWGFWQWDYGEYKMHATNEGWFGSGTKYGGADKAGHTYATYTMTRVLASLYRGFGYKYDQAVLYASFSSLFISSVMEVGDAFSSHGFSKEDFLMNVLGSYAGYLMEHHKALDNVLDVRLEYFSSRVVRNGDVKDILTDYDGMKFLAAFKAEAIRPFRENYMKYVELHVGYFTRGNAVAQVKRTAYVGLGLNLSALLNSDSKPLNAILEYYQVPHTYLPVEKGFDR